MGFFNSLWNGIKSAGKKVLGVGRKVVDGSKKILGGARNWVNKIKNVPVLGSIASGPLDAVDGVLKQGENVANTADDVVRVGESIAGR